MPTRFQSVAELSYEFIANMLRDNVGNEGRKYFPFVFTVFMFVLFSNVIGLILLYLAVGYFIGGRWGAGGGGEEAPRRPRTAEPGGGAAHIPPP